MRKENQMQTIKHEIHDLINALLNSKEKNSDHKPVSVIARVK